MNNSDNTSDTNYKMVKQWQLSINLDKAFAEMQALKLKYPWLKCDDTIAFLKQMDVELPKVLSIINHQEKQNNIHKKFIEVNQLADEAIVKAIESKFNFSCHLSSYTD